MAHSPQYQLFVDNELDRAPMLIDQVLQTVEEQAGRPGARGTEGTTAVGLRQSLAQHRGALIQRFCQSLRDQVTAIHPGTESSSRAVPRQTLSLVDESEVAADVELSRTVEAIASVAEYELRELRAYTSALVGDVNVSRETNPFRPEVYARALWTAASQLPPGYPVALMRHAAMPLAQSLRIAYAAATTRLDDAGVEPGAYRTIILPAGSRTARREFGHDDDSDETPSDLHELRHSMPVPLDEPRPTNAPPLEEALRRADEMMRLLPDEAGLATRSQVLESQRMRLLSSAGTRVDQQLIELLTRLFDAILTDRSLAPQVLVLLSRLHACALRVALRDPSMLDSFDHPVWQFLDHIAFASELRPRDDDPLREKLYAYTQSLIDNLVREPVQDAALFRWAHERLKALDRHLYEQRRQAAQPQIDALRREAASTDTRSVPIAPADAPIDIGSLDTVPAELLDHDDTTARAAVASPIWLVGHQPGDWVRLFLGGHWQIAQLLWRAEAATVWLYAEAHEGITWALRRPAVELLHREGLLNPLRPHSLIERAAESVLRQVTRSEAR